MVRRLDSFLFITPVHLYGTKYLSGPYVNKQVALGIQGSLKPSNSLIALPQGNLSPVISHGIKSARRATSKMHSLFDYSVEYSSLLWHHPWPLSSFLWEILMKHHSPPTVIIQPSSDCFCLSPRLLEKC